MSATLAQARPTTISPDLAAVCLFSLLGLTLSAAILSNLSSEMTGRMFSFIG